jgi:hypothetical protein
VKVKKTTLRKTDQPLIPLPRGDHISVDDIHWQTLPKLFASRLYSKCVTPGFSWVSEDEKFQF